MIEQQAAVDNLSLHPRRQAWRSLVLPSFPPWAHRAATILGLFLVLGLIAFFVDEERAQLPALRLTLARADWRWLFVAAVAQVAVFVVSILTNRSVLRHIGHTVAWRPLTGIYLRSVVAGTLSPVGVAGDVVAIRSLNDRGIPGDDAVFAWALADLAAFASSLVVLLPTAILLTVQARLPDVVVIAVALLAIVLAAIAALLVLVLGGEAAPAWLPRWLPRRAALFIKHARGHHLRVRDLLPALGWAVLGELGTIVVLGAALRAVQPQGFPIATPLIGYEVGNATSLVAPLFQGIGAVELAVTLALRHQRVGRHVALAATLLYRVAALWLPLAAGLLWQGVQRMLRVEGRSGDDTGADRFGIAASSATDAAALGTPSADEA